ncbi:MAG: zf-HC2 domain-containing protein [Acidobacteriota bacterium]|nr:zf-HC2 domain-containing protein [Acidobacteriota bacterium]
MDSNAFSQFPDCRREKIAAYFDGDLSPLEERAAEDHIASCGICTSYLNSLKMVSTSLEIFLDEEPTIPDEFSKRVTAAAESNMAGLRSPKERSLAVLIIAGLIASAAIAVTIGAVGSGIEHVPAQLYAVAALVGHFFYTAATGFSMIFGTICSKVFFGSTVAVALILALLLCSLIVFSKHIMRLNRS